MSYLPVTIVTGSPQQDGSRVFEQLLSNANETRFTAIVPKKGKRKRKAISNVTLVPTTEQLVRLGQGCACCTVRGDLMTKIRRIANEQSADHVVVRATPHSDLVTLAKTFSVANASGAVLSEVARIENLVMVVDAKNLLSMMETPPIRDVIERIELANVLVLENVQPLSPTARETICALLSALNPTARITSVDEVPFDLSSVRATQPFSLEQAQHQAERLQMSDRTPDITHNLVRFTYRARHPFHPTRFHQFVQQRLRGVVRANGTFWVASRPNTVGFLDVAGCSQLTASRGMFWAAVPQERWPQNEAFRQFISEHWHEAYGDREQDLSFVGLEIEAEAITAALDACLLTPAELAAPDRWAQLEHPFSWTR